MRQVEEISQRTTDGSALQVAYDGEYPFWWYLRHYPQRTDISDRRQAAA